MARPARRARATPAGERDGARSPARAARVHVSAVARRREDRRRLREAFSSASALALFAALLAARSRVARAELGVSGHDLSNFQGKHACARDVMMAKPSTVEETAAAVAAFPRVRANGVGHSWNRALFCAGDDDASLNVITTDVRSVSPPTPRRRRGRALRGAARRIERTAERAVLDESRGAVRVDAGVRLRDLLDYLANRPRLRGDDPYPNPDPDDPGVAGSILDVSGSVASVALGDGPDGYTLPAFPWFIDQTVGGAVATATHGSSLRHGSLSSQCVAATLVLANGTVASFDAETTPPALFDAVRASVGRLGVLVDVTLRVAPNLPVRKTSRTMEPFEFVEMVEAASEAMARCEDAFEGADVNASEDADGNDAAWACAFAAPEIRALDETQLFWFFPLGKIVGVTYRRLDDLPAKIMRSAGDAGVEEDENDDDGGEDDEEGDDRSADPSSDDLRTESFSSTSASRNALTSRLARISGAPDRASLRRLRRFVRAQPRDAPRDITETWPLLGNSTYAKFWARQWEASTRPNVESGVFRARDSYLTMTEEQYDAHDNFGYDQYETCVPLRRAGACARALADAMTDPATGDAGGASRGFRSQGLVRFVNAESAHLSPSNPNAAGACMYVNIEDYVRFATRPERVNDAFQTAMRVLRSDVCRGRLHWGKAGWPRAGCFDGAVEWGRSWCAFGCAARALDPEGKFGGVADAFRWNQSRLDACCQPDGSFSDACECYVEGRGVDAETGEPCAVEWDGGGGET